jgi:intracellular sulfur oxidation DsrE/DsrF family protein
LTTGSVAVAGAVSLPAAPSEGSPPAGAQSRSGGEGAGFQPARHQEDEWLERIPGKHRIVFDTMTVEGLGEGLAFMTNFYRANLDGYGLKDQDIAAVLVMRHLATPFAYNEAMWAKYGVQITQRTRFNDPKTNQPPKVNLYNATDYGQTLHNRGNTLDSLVKRGVHLAVCQLSTRAYSTAIAEATGQKAEDVYKELTSNLAGANAHMVPAGIVAVERAQTRGYSLATPIA